MSDLLGAAREPQDDLIKDATIESFEKDVLEASMAGPIVVDFWAEWCGPCKQLAPGLEKAVKAAGGKVKLVKVDIDKNQMLASQLRIQSVPTVYAFFQGRPVDGFQGAVPDSEINAFIERITNLGGEANGADAAPDIEQILTAAEAALEGGDVSKAAQAFSQVAQLEPENIRALGGLARCHVALGDLDQARQVLALVPDDKKADPALAAVTATLELSEGQADAGEVSALKARVDGDPSNMEARFELAEAQIAAGEMEPALSHLLTLIEQDRSWNEEAARLKLLKVFEALGMTHPLTLQGRRKLSSLLFS